MDVVLCYAFDFAMIVVRWIASVKMDVSFMLIIVFSHEEIRRGCAARTLSNRFRKMEVQISAPEAGWPQLKHVESDLDLRKAEEAPATTSVRVTIAGAMPVYRIQWAANRQLGSRPRFPER